MPHPIHFKICAAIEERGWAVEAAFLPEQAIAALRAQARRRDAAGEFHAAGIGRGAARVERSDIRGDRILWLDEHARCAAEAPLWRALAALQAGLNRALFLGLDSFEGHSRCIRPAPSIAGIATGSGTTTPASFRARSI